MTSHRITKVSSLLGIILLLVLFVQAIASTAVAQEAGVQVRPAIIEDKADPGETYRFNVTVTNVSGGDKKFYLNAQDIKGVDEGGRPVFATQGETTGYELSSWISFPESSISLKSGQSTTVPFSVKVPSNASPGAHFGAVFVEDRPVKPDESGAGVGFNVGTIVSLRIAGEIREEARIREFSTSKIIYGTADVAFNTKIENLGNVLVQPHGIIQISDMFGRQVGSVEVNNSAASVFPASIRSFSGEWKSDTFGFGRYEAIGSFLYGDDGRKTITAATSFWILPLKPLLMLLGGVLGVVVLMYVLVRVYINKKLRQMGASNKGDVNFYAQKYQRSGSRLIVVTLVTFLFSVIFLSILFFMFA
jgi:hypothetical protein